MVWGGEVIVHGMGREVIVDGVGVGREAHHGVGGGVDCSWCG